MKSRVYQDNRPKGTIYLENNFQMLGMSFKKDSELHKKYIQSLNNFLKENNLKIVNSLLSHRKHCNHKKQRGNKYFPTYYKKINSKTQKIEFVKLEKE